MPTVTVDSPITGDTLTPDIYPNGSKSPAPARLIKKRTKRKSKPKMRHNQY